MKKTGLFVFALIIALLLSSCNVTFDGYFYNIDDARADEKAYAKYDFIFTAESEDKIVDFIFNGEKMQISKIDCRDSGSKKQYKVKSIYASTIDEHIARLNANNEYNWIKTSNFPYQVEFCIVPKDFGISDNKVEYFKFDYKNAEYLLCYKIYTN